MEGLESEHHCKWFGETIILTEIPVATDSRETLI